MPYRRVFWPELKHYLGDFTLWIWILIKVLTETAAVPQVFLFGHIFRKKWLLPVAVFRQFDGIDYSTPQKLEDERQSRRIFYL
jgi:hypothetical protein